MRAFYEGGEESMRAEHGSGPWYARIGFTIRSRRSAITENGVIFGSRTQQCYMLNSTNWEHILRVYDVPVMTRTDRAIDPMDYERLCMELTDLEQELLNLIEVGRALGVPESYTVARAHTELRNVCMVGHEYNQLRAIFRSLWVGNETLEERKVRMQAFDRKWVHRLSSVCLYDPRAGEWDR